jgi:hypothetical protein
MDRGADSQREMLAHQLAHDREMRVYDRLHDLIGLGAKGLAFLNGGAVVAMLAFIQALVGRPVYSCFKSYALSALSCFLLGAFSSAIVFFFHYKAIRNAYTNTNPNNWGTLHKVVWGILILSTACALTGGVFVAIGIYVAV